MKQKTKKKHQKSYNTSNSFINNGFKECKHFINNDLIEYSKPILSQLKQDNKHLQNVSVAYITDYTSTAIKKRKAAYNEYADKIYNDCKDEIGTDDETLIKNNFAKYIVAVSSKSFNSLDKDGSVVAAVATWILEELVKQDKLEEIFPLIEEDYTNSITNVVHPFLSNKLITATANAICNRDGKQFRNINYGNIYHELSNKEMETVKDSFERKNWEAILSLIGEDVIKDAVDYFKEKSWEFIKIETNFSAVLSIVQDEITDAFKEEETIAKQKLLDFLKKHNPACAKKIEILPDDPQRLQMLISSCSFIDEAYTHSIIRNMSAKEHKYRTMMDAIQDSLECDLSSEKGRQEAFDGIRNYVPTELIEEIELSFDDISVKELGKIGFAIIYLLDINDLFVWIHNSSIGILRKARAESNSSIGPSTNPWITYQNLKNQDNEFQTINSKLFKLDDLTNSIIEKLPDDLKPIFNNRKISSPVKRNTTQLLSDITNTTFSSLIIEGKSCESAINRLFKPETDKEKEYLLCLMQLLIKTSFRETIPSYEEYKIDQLLEENYDLEEEIVALRENNPQLAEIQEKHSSEMSALNKKIKQLEKQLHKANKTIEEIKSEKEDIEKENRLQKQELGYLREFVFKAQNKSNNENEEQPADTEFPFYSNEVIPNVVCYGGHKSWLKNMRELLPDVTFVDAEVIPNPTLFKGADAIWLQTNKMSHSFFYSIINIARKSNIPVYYFTYGSHQKCAEQFVDTIKKCKRDLAC